MIIENLRQRIEVLLPNPHCTIWGDDYEIMDWLDERPKPTEAEILQVTEDQLKELLKGPLVEKLREEMHEYIYSRYDQGSQSSALGWLMLPISQSTKDLIMAAFMWIGTVTTYYVKIKKEIRASSTPEKVVWDFSQFNETVPQYEGKDLTYTMIKDLVDAELNP